MVLQPKISSLLFLFFCLLLCDAAKGALQFDCLDCESSKSSSLPQGKIFRNTQEALLDSLNLHSAPYSGKKRQEASALRTIVYSENYPWSAIGKVRLVGKGTCTGTLVGACYVATAMHCIYDAKKKAYRTEDIEFQSSAAENSVKVRDWVDNESFKTSNANGEDWAILRLDSSVGEEYGWMGVAKDLNAVHLAQGNPLRATGYNVELSKTKLSSDDNVKLISIANGVLTTDARTGEGTSGGPVWREEGDSAVLYGINVSIWEERKCSSPNNCLTLKQGGWAAAPQNFREQLEEIKKKYPCI